MRSKHPAFDSDVPLDSVLWRYMDFPKFVSMLAHRALYFSRADLLGDGLEGSLTQAQPVLNKQILENVEEDKASHEMMSDLLSHASELHRGMPGWSYVNCWHIGAHESMALWQGYGRGYGVAVTTTFGKLSDVVPTVMTGIGPADASTYLARVRYVDYTSTTERIRDRLNFLVPLFWKSIAYKHENEVRIAFAWIPKRGSQPAEFPSGHFVEVDLRSLIDEVVVSPLAPVWFEALARSVCDQYGFEFRFRESLMNVPPVY